MAVLAVVAAVAGSGAYLHFSRSSSFAHQNAPGAEPPETTAALLARVRELEARVAELEHEKTVLEAAVAGREPGADTVADVDDPEVVPPTLVREGPLVESPPAASGPVRVLVEAVVAETGRVLEARTVHTSVVGRGFEEAAERRVAGRVYRPATRHGTPVRVRIRVPVDFGSR